MSSPFAASLTAKQAAAYLGVNARWLDDAPIPKADIRKAGAGRPVWRWRKADLDEFLQTRLVLPGQVNPFTIQ